MKLSMDKRLIIPSVFALALIICILIINVSISLKKRNAVLKAQRDELAQLKAEYSAVRDRVDALESKKSLSKVEGINQAVDQIFRSLGLSQKVKSVKSIGTWDKKYGIEEEAEVQVEKVTMNELTNIFYRIENVPMILSISKADMKTSFDSPTLLNITMTLSLIRPK